MKSHLKPKHYDLYILLETMIAEEPSGLAAKLHDVERTAMLFRKDDVPATREAVNKELAWLLVETPKAFR